MCLVEVGGDVRNEGRRVIGENSHVRERDLVGRVIGRG